MRRSKLCSASSDPVPDSLDSKNLQVGSLKKLLFITWDGPQVSYLESLFLPIFRELAKAGVSFHILQFTWGDSRRIKEIKSACNDSGFTYQSEIILRRPVAAGSLITALKGACVIRKAIRKQEIDVVMPRSTLPALSTLLALSGSSLPIIFDADGLPLDERVDFSGQSPLGLVQRLLRDVEARAIRRANVVLTRTARAVDILHMRSGPGIQRKKFHVVSNGRDPQLFSPGNEYSRVSLRSKLHIPIQAPLLVYAGSIGTQYCVDEMLSIFEAVRQKVNNAHFLVLTGAPDKFLAKNKIVPEELRSAIIVRRVTAGLVPEYLAAGDVGLALRRKSFSMQGVSPIKIGEYLLCGLPVIATEGIGNTDCIKSDVGYMLSEPSGDGLMEAVSWFVDSVMPNRNLFREKSRAVGIAEFSLESSVKAYERAFSQLTL